MSIPSPKIQHGNNLSVIEPNDTVKNALMLGIKLMFIRACRAYEDISKLNDDIVSDGRGLHVYAKNG